MRIRWLSAVLLGLSLTACGGNDTREVNCEASLKYQNRVEGKRIVAPEGLDSLSVIAEMPIPKADPDAPKMPPGACNDMPPMIQVSGR